MRRGTGTFENIVLFLIFSLKLNKNSNTISLKVAVTVCIILEGTIVTNLGQCN